MKSIVRLIVAALLLYAPINVQGQIKVDLKKKLENKVNQRLNQRTDQAIDKGLDAVENDVKGEPDKSKKEGQAAGGQEKPEANDMESASAKDQAAAGTKEQEQLQSYSKYDFVPGEKVIFYDDFSQDAVGDFPVLWNTNGSAEVVTTNLFPGKWMKFVMDQCVWTDELLQLPENYTIEYDIIPIGGLEGPGMSGWHMRLMQAKNVKAWDSGSAPETEDFSSG